MASRTFPIQPPSKAFFRKICLYAVLAAVLVCLPIAALSYYAADNSSERALGLGISFFIFACIALPAFPLLWGLSRMASKASFELTGHQLKVHRYDITHVFELADCQADQARVVDLDAEPDLRPRLYFVANKEHQAFRFYNYGPCQLYSDDQALLCTTDAQSVVYIPMRNQLPLMISPQDPEDFLQALREKIPASPPA